MSAHPETITLIGQATRTDAAHEPALSERVRTVIELRGGLPRGQLHVSEAEGAIVLEGELTRFYDRQIAVTCARHVPGVRCVIDRITVRDPRRPPDEMKG